MINDDRIPISYETGSQILIIFRRLPLFTKRNFILVQDKLSLIVALIMKNIDCIRACIIFLRERSLRKNLNEHMFRAGNY